RRISEGNQVLALAKRWGVMLRRQSLLEGGGEQWLTTQLAQADVPGRIVTIAQDLWKSFEQALDQERKLHEQLCQLARRDKIMSRVMELPGYGSVRAATLISYLDTPWRFKSRAALWKYVGIGLKRQKSGEGLDYIG